MAGVEVARDSTPSSLANQGLSQAASLSTLKQMPFSKKRRYARQDPYSSHLFAVASHANKHYHHHNHIVLVK